MYFLFYDGTVDLAECASSVCFVGVDVHSEREVRIYSYDYVAVYGLAVSRLDAYGNYFLVADTELLGVCGSHVDVALCDDNAFGYLDFTCRSDELASGSSRDVAALSYGSSETERSCIGEGKLYLSRGTNGSENDYVRNGLLGSFDGDTLLASELTGLAEVLLEGESSTCTEEGLEILLREVDVSCGCFNDKIFHFIFPFYGAP